MFQFSKLLTPSSVILWAGLFAGVAHAAPAGTTPASFGVSHSGAATYSVPIAVPAGIGGIQPELSLEYDSQAGRGIGSTGWSLRGVSSVKRCPQTKRQDGVRGAITLTSSDRFCLDGQRLVLDGTAYGYGSAGAVYRTEIDSFARVTSLGAAGAGPQSFRVESKSGLTTEFGGSVSSRLVPGPVASGGAQPTTIALWSISRVVDRIGNEATYSYVTDVANGSQVLDRIDYNRGKAYVKFIYVDDSNPRTAYIAGTRVTHPKLLKQVQTFVLDDAGVEKSVKSYVIQYDFSDVKGDITQKPVARLTSIQECGADGQCLNPIAFAWASWTTASRVTSGFYAAGTGNAFPAAAWGDERVRYRRFADMNGDGKLDIVGFGDDGVYVLSSTSGTGSAAYEASAVKKISDFGKNQGWDDSSTDLSIAPRHLVDMDGDGYPDIVGFVNLRLGSGQADGSSGVYLSKWDPVNKQFLPKTRPVIAGGEFFTGSNWQQGCSAGSDLGQPKYLADMNGDGYPDIVGFHANGVYVSLWDGTQFAAPVLVSSAYRMQAGGWLGSSTECYGVNIQPIFLEDVNGDGYPDIVGVSTSGVYVALWNPASGVSGAFNAPLPVYTGITAQPRNSTQFALMLADMNGDGYPDLVQLVGDGANVAIWNGAGFNPVVKWTHALPTADWNDSSRNPRRLADINGDGFPDLIAFANDGVYVALSNGRDGFSAPTRWSNMFPSNSTDIVGNVWGQAAIDSPRQVLDLNGDGVPDILGFGTAAVQWTTPSGAPGTRITGLTDSLGATIALKYSLTQQFSGFYADDQPAAVWPLRDGHGPTLVVTEVARDDGLSATQKSRYRYGGRKSHFDYGPLGFSWMAVRDEATGIETRTDFEQTYPFIGWPKKIETYRSSITGETVVSGCYNTTVLCAKTFTVTASQPSISRSTMALDKESLGIAGEYSSNPRWFPFVRSVTEERWELDGTALPTKTSTSYYEEPSLVAGSKQWGNLTKRNVALSDGHSTLAVNTYEPAAETTWTLGRLSRATVTSSRPARTIAVSAPADGAPPPQSASPLPISPAILSTILSLLLDD